MKSSQIFLYSLLFAIASGVGVIITVTALTGKTVMQLKDQLLPSTSPIKADVPCTSFPAIQNLSNSSEPHLQKLSEYQDVCKSYVTNHMMLFTDMPSSIKGAKSRAASMSATLKEFAKYGIQPIVIAEPSTDWGLIDFIEFKNGLYAPWLNQYFAALRKSGITDAQMGTWVPFPEANLPIWNRGTSTPADYAADVSLYLTIMKKYFPKASGSVLLDSTTYAGNDFNWSNGQYQSLVPYVKDIKPGLVNSFGLQGFPWTPQAGTTDNSITDPSQFLSSKMAIDAATTLKVKTIWFNTGTYTAKYTNDPNAIVFISPLEREAILNGVITEAQKVKNAGFFVWINLFSEDKSDTTEATNWSYLQDPTDSQNLNVSVFDEFVSAATKQGIGLSLYDSVPDSTAVQQTNGKK